MRLPSFFRGVLAGALALSVLSACRDELPTVSGDDLFPGGMRPTTIELILSPDQVVLDDTVYSGFASLRDPGFQLVANGFDGVLNAHALSRFVGFPDTIPFTLNGNPTQTTDFVYGAGTVLTAVNPLRSTSAPTTLRLWALEQAWDTAHVTWTVAERVNGTAIPWRVPGGTRGVLLSEASWAPADTAARDTVRFAVDSLTVARMATESFHGVLVTSETPGTRLEISSLILRTVARPAARPDTAVSLAGFAGPQAFIHSPDRPHLPGSLSVGGLGGERAVIRLKLDQQVPACANPATTPNCPMVPLRDVTLNYAALLVEPLRVPSGFRPLQAPQLHVRRLLEPELGRRAPLGELLFVDTLPVARFENPAGAPLALDLTRAVTRFTADGLSELTIALLTEPEGLQFSYLFFADRPRLRLLYTLPLRPTFP